MREKSLLCIYILKILNQYSSKTHKLRQVDVIQYLERDYEICVNRNTLSRYIRELKEYGVVSGERGIYLIRTFSGSEIMMLFDTLMYSQAIPEQNVKTMAEKLIDMAEPELRKFLTRTYYLDKVWHVENENIGKITWQIGQAIEKCRKIEITNCKYTIDGKLVPTGTRVIDPYYIVMEKSRYYLLCYAGRDDVEPRRIDRIYTVRVLNERRKEISEIPKYRNHDFSLAKYMEEHIYMYSGEEERITIRIERENIGDFIDWYGKEYRILSDQQAESSDVVIQIRANANAVYFWALQYGRIAEILSPKSLRVQIRKGLEEMMEKYKKDLP